MMWIMFSFLMGIVTMQEGYDISWSIIDRLRSSSRPMP